MQIEVNSTSVDYTPEVREFLQRRFDAAFDRFQKQIRELRVRLSDLNGPRGGVDKSCRVSIKLTPRGEMVLEQRGDEIHATIASAVERASENLAQRLAKQRDAVRQPRRPRVREA